MSYSFTEFTATYDFGSYVSDSNGASNSNGAKDSYSNTYSNNSPNNSPNGGFKSINAGKGSGYTFSPWGWPN